jgi:hypothetical protein
VPSCGAVVRSWTVGIVRSSRVFSYGGVVRMGTVEEPCCTLEGQGVQSSPSTRGSIAHCAPYL